jgi:hypothetical protein
MKQRLEEARKKCMRILEKQFWNQIRSYFVKRGECSDMVNWLKDKSLTGRLMFKSNPELRGELL